MSSTSRYRGKSKSVASLPRSTIRKREAGELARWIQSYVDANGDPDNVSCPIRGFTMDPGELDGAWCLLFGGTLLVKSRRSWRSSSLNDDPVCALGHAPRVQSERIKADMGRGLCRGRGMQAVGGSVVPPPAK